MIGFARRRAPVWGREKWTVPTHLDVEFRTILEIRMKETADKKEALLWRYTTLPVLFDTLLNAQITLVCPEKWLDKNDSYFMEVYKERRQLKTLLALCLANTSERFHFWRSFSYGSDGVRITFRKEMLLSALNASIYSKGFRFRPLKYKSIADLESSPPKVETLPFLKRLPYKDECEYRIVYQSKTEQLEFLPVPIELTCIEEITLGPSIHKKLQDGVKKVLRGIPGCASTKFTSTTVEDSERWKNAGDAATD